MNEEAAEQSRKASVLGGKDTILRMELLQLFTQLRLEEDAANAEKIREQIEKSYLR